MLITIPDVLSVGEVAQARAALDAAEWVDGKVTAGYQAQSVKENLQLPEGHPVAVKLGEMVLTALARSPLFMSAAVVSNLQYRLTEVKGGTLIVLRHSAFGFIPDDMKGGISTGWKSILTRARTRAEALSSATAGRRKE